MRTHNLTKIFNTLLTASALLLIYISIRNLFFQNKSDFQSLSEFIGNISNYSNTVSLKRNEKLNWEFIETKNLKVASNDSVFTHKESTALINLDDSKDIAVNSESMIRIQSAQKIILGEGKVDIIIKKSSEPFIVQVQQKEFSITANQSSRISIQRKNDQNIFSVSSGEIQLKTPEEKSIVIKEGITANIKDNLIKTTQVNTKLLFPQGKIIRYKGEKINFNYKTNQKVEQIYIKRADKDFFIAPNEQMNLKADQYQWGITSKKDSPADILQEFTLIKKIEPPIQISPLQFATIQTFQLPVEITFRWSEAQPVLIEVFNEQQELVVSKLLSKSKETTLPIEHEGLYNWRISINDQFITSDMSPEHKFIVKKEVKENNDFPYFTIELEKPNQLVEFNWEQTKQDKVEFTLAKDKEFKNVITTKQIKSNGLKVRIKEPGIYYWKLNQNDVIPTKVFIVPIPAPTVAPKVKNIIQEVHSKPTWPKRIIEFFLASAHADQIAPTKISWEKMKHAKSYQIEIYKNKTDTTPAYSLRSDKNIINWHAPDYGLYFYRVRMKDHWDRYSPFSEFAEIKIISQSQKTIEQTQISNLYKTPTQEQTANLNIFRFAYAVSQIQSKQSDTQDIKINGTSPSGHFLGAELNQLKFSIFTPNINYVSQYGTVFDDLEFSQRQLRMHLLTNLKRFRLGFGAGFHHYSSYKIEQNKVKLSETKNLYSLSLYADLPISIGDSQLFNTFFIYELGELTNYQFGLTYQYHLSSWFNPLLQISSERSLFKNSNTDFEIQKYQLLIGTAHSF